jgi:AcrR family transcriptional regulator
MARRTGRVYESSRDRILDAAERVLLRDGGRVSIDAVLTEAALSKGGLFHHFESKDALLAAVTERLHHQVATRAERSAGDDGQPGSAALRAQIRMAFDLPAADRGRLQALALALIEAARGNPAVAHGARASNELSVARAKKTGTGAGPALVVQLALDGYWLAESLGSLRLSPAEREALRDTLLDLTRPARSTRRPR